ncbi:MAG: DUF367 family protein [Candidatus Methanospirareceae archaeon]
MLLYGYDAGQCDPKRCTMKKLVKMGLVKPLKNIKRIPQGTILLNPYAEKALSPEDRHARSITVFDCSWRRIEAFEAILRNIKRESRALPFLIAVNPTNFGKPFILSSAEALSAALFILGEREQSYYILSKFKWGLEFFRLNKHMLEEYSKAKNSKEVIKIQERFLGGA